MQHKEKILSETSAKKWAPKEKLATIKRKMDVKSEFVIGRSCIFMLFELFILSNHFILTLNSLVQKERIMGTISMWFLLFLLLALFKGYWFKNTLNLSTLKFHHVQHVLPQLGTRSLNCEEQCFVWWSKQLNISG